MSLTSAVARARRIVRKRPGYLAERAKREATCELDRWLAPRRERGLDRKRLLALANAHSVESLWMRLADRPYPAVTISLDADALDRLVPGETTRILAAAEKACNRTVDLLGTGPIALGSPIDWSRDYRANMGWPRAFARSIDYVNRDRPSDVKIPWEISRLQWLVPAGQAYLLTGDERYAGAVREILEEWMRGNPLAYTVNWSCAMEAALRIFTWTWFFHVFARSRAWGDEDFRVRFLACLYLHVDFTHRHIEKADTNGNHFAADLAGLVFGGLFFGEVGNAPRWAALGWSGLVDELPRQVFADGVDYEASCAYHRFVFELFLWPALFRQAVGSNVPTEYSDRLRKMARFTATYSRADGTSPLWGDADDARALPFAGSAIGDHRYLVGLAAIAFKDPDLAAWFDGPRSELAWVFGMDRARDLPRWSGSAPPSSSFPDGGCYIMRDGGSHVFIDCGPIGLAGRGGHGHNDALSFEAWLDGAPLISDCGSYVYTGSFEARNRFRSTGSHNTPQVEGEEINRFIDPDNLWNLHDDARPICTEWRTGLRENVFIGTHRGYERLGIEVTRGIRLDNEKHLLAIIDELRGEGQHRIMIPFHLAPQVTIERSAGGLLLHSAGRSFAVSTELAEDWMLDIEPCFVSPSYGVLMRSQRLVWRTCARLPVRLEVIVRSVSSI